MTSVRSMEDFVAELERLEAYHLREVSRIRRMKAAAAMDDDADPIVTIDLDGERRRGPRATNGGKSMRTLIVEFLEETDQVCSAAYVYRELTRRGHDVESSKANDRVSAVRAALLYAVRRGDVVKMPDGYRAKKWETLNALVEFQDEVGQEGERQVS